MIIDCEIGYQTIMFVQVEPLAMASDSAVPYLLLRIAQFSFELFAPVHGTHMWWVYPSVSSHWRPTSDTFSIQRYCCLLFSPQLSHYLSQGRCSDLWSIKFPAHECDLYLQFACLYSTTNQLYYRSHMNVFWKAWIRMLCWLWLIATESVATDSHSVDHGFMLPK